MDKKLLVSVMMATPVAAFAQATYTPDGGYLYYRVQAEFNRANWYSNVMEAVTPKDGVLVCTPGAGSLSHSQTGMLLGEYNVTINGLKNAVLWINGQALVMVDNEATLVSPEDYAELTNVVAASNCVYNAEEESVSLEIKPIDNTQDFEAGALSMEFDFDFGTAKTTLADKLAEIVLTEPNADDYMPDAIDALQAKYDSLDAQKTAINTEIEGINLDDADSLVNAYKNYDFAKYADGEDKINEEIAALKTANGEYNDDCTTEADRKTTYDNNEAAYNAALAAITDFQKQLDAKKVPFPADDFDEKYQEAAEAYATPIFNEAVDAAQEAINNYKTAIEEAYKDLENVDTDNLPSDEGIEDLIEAVSWKTPVADYKAYLQFEAYKADVQNAYEAAFATINSKFTAPELTNVWNESVAYNEEVNIYFKKIVEWNTALSKAFGKNDGYNEKENDGITGMSEWVSSVEEEVKARKAAFTAIVNGADEVFNTQTDNWESVRPDYVDNVYGEYETVLDGIDEDGLDLMPEATQTNIENLKTAYAQAVENLWNEIKTDYNNVELKDSYSMEAVTTAKEALENAYNEILGDMASIQAALDVKKKLAEIWAEIEPTELVGFFTEQHDNLVNALDNYLTDPTQDLKAISDAVVTFGESWKTVYKAWTTSEEKIEALDEAQKALAAAITGVPAQLVGENEFAASDLQPYETQSSAWATEISGYQAEFNKIKENSKADPQEVYDAAKELLDKMSLTVDEINAETLALAKAVTSDNIEYIKTVQEKLSDDKTAAYKDEPGFEEYVTDKIPADVDLKDITTRNDEAEAPATCEALNNELKDIYAQYQEPLNNLQKIIDNKALYEAILEQIDTTNSAINSASANLNTVSPALEWYRALAPVTEPGIPQLQKIVKDEKAKLEAAYATFAGLLAASETDEVTTVGGAIDARLKAVVDTDIPNLNKIVEANDAAYLDQVNQSQSLADYCTEVLTQLAEQEQIEGFEDQTNLKNYIEDTVRPALTDIDVKLTEGFGMGQSKTEDYNFDEDFNNYRETIKSMLDSELAALATAIAAENERLINSEEFGINTDDLRTAYKYAIDTVNDYLYKLNGDDAYKAMLENIIAKANTLYELQSDFEAMSALQTRINAYVTACNGDLKLVSVEDDTYAAEGDGLKATYDAITNFIREHLAKVNIACYDGYENYVGAKSFFNDQYTIADTLLTNAITALEEAGISVDPEDEKTPAGLVTFIGYRDDAKEFQDADANREEPLPTVIADVTAEDNVAFAAYITDANTQLVQHIDPIIDALQDTYAWMNEICDEDWSTRYQAALDKLDELNITQYVGGAGYKGYKATYDTAVERMDDLNTDFADEEIKYDVLADYVSRLEAYLATAEKAAADAKAGYENNQANRDAKAALLPLVEAMKAAIDQLEGFGNYRTQQVADVESLLDDYKAFDNTVNTSSELYGNETYGEGDDAVEGLNQTVVDELTNFYAALAADYRKAYNEEYQFASTVLVQAAQTAFNNAFSIGKADNADSATLTGYIEALKALATYDADKKEVNMASIKDIEESLCEYIAKYEALYHAEQPEGPNTVKAAFDALTTKYNGVNEALTALVNAIDANAAATDTYGEATKSEMSGKLGKLQTRLEAISNDIENGGSLLIAEQARIDYLLTGLAADIQTLQTEFNTAKGLNEKYYNSDVRYEALIGQLNTYMTNVNDAHGILTNEEGAETNALYIAYRDMVGYTTSYGTKVPGTFTVLENKLESLKSSHGLESTSTLDNIVSYISGFAGTNGTADKYVRDALIATANAIDASLVAKVQGGIDQINNAIGEKYVNSAELLRQLNALKTKVQNESVTYTNLITYIEGDHWYGVNNGTQALTAYNGSVTATFGDLDQEIKDLLQTVADSSYFLGDVNLEPDGLVNVQDVLIVANWIGNSPNLTAAELYQERYAIDARSASAADVVGDDKINTSDLTAIIDLSLGKNVLSGRMAAPKAPKATLADGDFALTYVGEVDGADRYAVVLNNQTPFIAGQFDIRLADGSRVINVVSTDRTSEHAVQAFDNDDVTRVLIYSMENASIAGVDGAVAFIDIVGSAKAVDHVAFTDANHRTYELNSGVTTVTDMIVNAASKAKDMIYDAAGRMYNKLQRGINIIRKADGTTTKEIRK